MPRRPAHPAGQLPSCDHSFIAQLGDARVVNAELGEDLVSVLAKHRGRILMRAAPFARADRHVYQPKIMDARVREGRQKFKGLELRICREVSDGADRAARNRAAAEALLPLRGRAAEQRSLDYRTQAGLIGYSRFVGAVTGIVSQFRYAEL